MQQSPPPLATFADGLAIIAMALICSAVVACGILFLVGGFSS
jgi:hypothetical protein